MKKLLMALPAALAAALAALPVVFCPACWPLYAGVLSALGVSFIDYSPYIVPLVSVLIFLALCALLWNAPQRYGYRPFILGLLGAGLLLSGRFYLEIPELFYGGAALLFTASVWNIWPKKSCGLCK